MLNTRLHLPNESAAALQLFKGDYTTKSYDANAFLAWDDFAEFAGRLGLVPKRAERILKNFADKYDAVCTMIAGSELPEECKQLYKSHVADRVKALGYSFTRRQSERET